MAKGKNGQRHAVVKHSKAATHDELTFAERRPGGSDSWRKPHGRCLSLILHPATAVDRQARHQCPMILDEESVVHIGFCERSDTREIDPLERVLVGIPNLDGIKRKTSAVADSRNQRSELQCM